MNPSIIRANYRYVIAGAGILVLMACIGLGRLTYPIILPAMKKGLNLTYTQAGFITTGNSVGFVVGSLIAGWLISRWGPRLITSCGMLGLGIALGTIGLSPTYLMSLCAQLIAGTGVGIGCVGIMAIPASWFIPRRRGAATGVMNIGTGIGTTLSGLILPNVMGLAQGWRMSWYIVGLTVIFLSIIVYFALRDGPEDIGLKPPELVDTRTHHENGEKESYFSTTLSILCLIQLIWGIAYAIYYTFFVIRLTDGVGLKLDVAGSIWAVVGLVSIVSGLLCGFFSDLVGRKQGILIVLLALALSAAGIALNRETFGFYLFGAIGGLVFNGLPPVIAAACQDRFDPDWIPKAIGFTLVFSALGQGIGPWLGGFLADMVNSFVWVYIAAALLFIGSGALSLTLK